MRPTAAGESGRPFALIGKRTDAAIFKSDSSRPSGCAGRWLCGTDIFRRRSAA